MDDNIVQLKARHLLKEKNFLGIMTTLTHQ